MKKKVLLIGPQQEQFKVGQYTSPSYGIYRLASWVKDKADVTVIDPTLNMDLLNKIINEETFDIIGYSILQPSIESSIKTIFDVSKKQPSALHIAGGQGAAFNAKDILDKTSVQVVVKGYGEFALEEIIDKGVSTEIPGIITKNYETIQKKMTAEDFSNISLNVDLSIIPYNEYWNKVLKTYNSNILNSTKTNNLVKTIRLSTTNYCSVGCIHCSSTNFLKENLNDVITLPQVLSLSAENIVNLIEKSIEAHPEVEAFYFNDDDFTKNKKRLEQFCKISKEKFNSKYNYLCLSRVDNVDDESLKMMAEAGFKVIFYGVETFSQKLAEKMNKKISKSYGKQAYDAIYKTLQTPIKPQISLILFYPGSTLEDLYITTENSLDLIDKGALITIHPYVEALKGSSIINTHQAHIEYTNFNINNVDFTIPHIVKPEDSHIYDLSKKAIYLKNEEMSKLNSPHQVIDSLMLFKKIYELTHKDTSKIDSILKKYM